MTIENNIIDLNGIKANNLSNSKIVENKNNKELRKVCNDFEAFFMNQILETSLKSTSVAGSGTGSEIIKGMYTDAVSQQSAGSLGISDMLFKFLSENKR
jgi:Rod binding domain-containing protein